jgi:hypothetical protein
MERRGFAGYGERGGLSDMERTGFAGYGEGGGLSDMERRGFSGYGEDEGLPDMERGGRFVRYGGRRDLCKIRIGGWTRTYLATSPAWSRARGRRRRIPANLQVFMALKAGWKEIPAEVQEFSALSLEMPILGEKSCTYAGILCR